MKYNGKFKVRFEGEPMFHINEKKGVVTCRLKCFLETPSTQAFWLDYPHICNTNISGIGIAKCNKEDVFDENRGKRIALARAENDCYLKAARYLNEQGAMLNSLLCGIEEFTDKAYGCCAHNDDYVDSLVFASHPFYKKDVTAPKRGIIITRK